jgi:hypothetical protein
MFPKWGLMGEAFSNEARWFLGRFGLRLSPNILTIDKESLPIFSV